MKNQNQPDYKKIYNDLIVKKYPEKLVKCRMLLQKKELSVLDIICLNQMIFEKTGNYSTKENQKFRSYDKNTICYILDYQKEYKLNNIQLANHFNLSRNTVAKWKKLYT
ncbi:helix-turn-helix domain-containing protein [Chryseobacterium sp. MIQD13]|uniref:helix-turn-helix domain-containing protein n=1 Tax=Chryseobacterium sp. MIQD13 TaxID=3422310 RepID=UPI003D2C524C